MLKLEQVPDTVAWKLHNKLWGSSQFSVEEGRAAIAAALNAWPGMYRADWNDKNELDPVIILPLPQETRDDE